MVAHCCVPHCLENVRSKSNSTISFHSFPNDANLRKKWMHCVRRDPIKSSTNPIPFVVNRHVKVCSKHFRPEDYLFGSLRVRLAPNAIPSIFPWALHPQTPVQPSSKTMVSLPTTENAEGEKLGVTAVGDENDKDNACKNLGPSSSHLRNPVALPLKEQQPANVTPLVVASEHTDLCMKKQRPSKHTRQQTQSNTHHICRICKKRLSCRSFLRQHMKEHNRKRPFKCTKCPLKCTTKQKLDMHTAKHMTVFVCDVCKKSLSSKPTLEQHMEIHTGNRPHNCKNCPKSFITKQRLIFHAVTHGDFKTYCCNICQKCCGGRRSLTQHLLVHAGFSHTCSQCPKAYTTKMLLNEHLKRKHFGMKFYECDICKKILSFRCTMIEHLQIHTWSLSYTCSQCPKSFTSKKNLFRHYKKHFRMKFYECDICKKKLSLRSAMIKHLRFHAKRISSQCPKADTSKQILIELKRKHISSKKFYECDICKTILNFKPAMINHLRFHAKVRLFACTLCPKSFSREEYLTLHVCEHAVPNTCWRPWM